MFMLRPRQRGHTPALSLLSISAPTHIGLSHIHMCRRAVAVQHVLRNDSECSYRQWAALGLSILW